MTEFFIMGLEGTMIIHVHFPSIRAPDQADEYLFSRV